MKEKKKIPKWLIIVIVILVIGLFGNTEETENSNSSLKNSKKTNTSNTEEKKTSTNPKTNTSNTEEKKTSTNPKTNTSKKKKSSTTSKTNNKKKSSITFGTLLEENKTCKEYDDNMNCKDYILVLKVKIESSYNNKATINQNYFNIEDYIKKHNTNKYSEIQYWAVADMKNGNENKVISFTVPKDVISSLKKQKIAANQLGDYVEDLYILPSLKDK